MSGTHVSSFPRLLFIAVKFADQPLGIRQTIIKEKIRSAAMRKEERSRHQVLRSISSVRCSTFHYRVSVFAAVSKESPVCQQAFRNIYGILQRSWNSLKKAAVTTDPGPLQHGNANKRNRHHGSIVAATRNDVIDFLVELGQKEGESYATRFTRERTSILIRKDEEDLVELPSSYTKRKIYER